MIKKNFSKLKPYLLWFLGLSFFALQYLGRNSIALIRHELMAEMAISATNFGTIAGVFYIGYALLQIPYGLVLDSYRPNIVLASTALIYTLGIIIMALATNWWWLIAARFFIGFGAIGGFLGTVKIIQLYLPNKHQGLMIALTFSFGFLGAIYSGEPCSILINKLGWRNFYYLLTIPNLIIAMLFFIALSIKPAIKITQGNVRSNLRQVLQNRNIVLLAVYGGLTIGVIEGLSDGWGVSLLHAKEFSLNTASFINSMIYLGLCFGSPCLAYLCQKLFKNQQYGGKLLLTYTSFAMSILSFVYIYFQSSYNIMFMLAILLGWCTGNQALIFVVNTKQAKPQAVAITTAVTNSIVMSFGIIFHQAIGLLVDYSHKFEPQASLSTYTLDNFQFGLYIIPALSIIGAMGFYHQLIAKSR
ncbi:MAG: MFS transporter [Pseudomonadota bacterium]